MSIRLMSEVWKSAKEVKSERLIVLLALADWANDDGLCWPKMATIAEKARVSKGGATAIVSWLEENGYISVQRGVGRGNQSTYIVHSTPVKRSARNSNSDDIKGHPEKEKVILNGAKGHPENGDIYGTRVLTISEPSVKEPSGDVSASAENSFPSDSTKAELLDSVVDALDIQLEWKMSRLDAIEKRKVWQIVEMLQEMGDTAADVKAWRENDWPRYLNKTPETATSPSIAQMLSRYRIAKERAATKKPAVSRVDPKRIDALTERINRHKAAAAAQ